MHRLRICKTLWFALKKIYFIAKTRFCAVETEIVPKVKYFKKFLSDFKKQGLKLKGTTRASYFEKKKFNFFLIQNFHNFFFFYRLCYFYLFFFCQHICSILTNEVSNEILLLHFLIYEKKNRFTLDLKFSQKNVIFYGIFFQKFCFLLTIMFNFNK